MLENHHEDTDARVHKCVRADKLSVCHGESIVKADIGTHFPIETIQKAKPKEASNKTYWIGD